MNILGLDQATTTGWAVAEDDPTRFLPEFVKHGHFRAPKRPLDSERLAHIHRAITELVERFEPALIVLEEPFFPWQGTGGAQAPKEGEEQKRSKWQFNLSTVKWLQMVKGVVLSVCGEHSIPFEEYPPQSWRKTFTGHGFAPHGEDENWMKREVLAVARRMGFEPGIQDEADALGVLKHAIAGPPGHRRRQGDLFSMLSETM